MSHTIAISDELFIFIKERGKMGESYDDVIKRLILDHSENLRPPKEDTVKHFIQRV